MYEPSDAGATGIGSNPKAPCLGYMPRAGEVASLTQRYGPESLSQHVALSCSRITLRRPWPVNGLFLLTHRSNWSIVVDSGLP